MQQQQRSITTAAHCSLRIGKQDYVTLTHTIILTANRQPFEEALLEGEPVSMSSSASFFRMCRLGQAELKESNAKTIAHNLDLNVSRAKNEKSDLRHTTH